MNQRLNWADSLRGILIILVVLGHAIQFTMKDDCFSNHLWNYISSFHVPAFMAISGFLNFKRGRGKDRFSVFCKRIRQLLVPCLLWSLVKVLFTSPNSLSSYIKIFLYPDNFFWFLWILFLIQVVFLLGDWIAEILKIRQEIIIGCFALLLVAIMVLTEYRFFGYQFLSYYFVFYCLGYYYHKYFEHYKPKIVFIVALTLIWLCLAWFWRMDEMPEILGFIPLPHSILHYTHRFFTAIIAVYVIFAISPKLLDKELLLNKPFVWMGQVSLGIYVFHLLFVADIARASMNIVSSEWIGVSITLIITLSISCMAVWLMNKWKISARYLLGKI